jgi:hypothetical protein
VKVTKVILVRLSRKEVQETVTKAMLMPILRLAGCQVAACTEVDHAAMASAAMPSSLADRAHIIGLMERTAAACAKCVLQTVASVCGADCVKERLHIVTDFEVEPLPCLPELAARLALGEAEGLARAVAAGEPIGVVLRAASSHLTDLYVPVGGAGKYQGADGGAFAYTCDEAVHGPVLAISPASPADAAACDGELWIDLRTGRARSERVAAGNEGTPTVPVDFELGWAGCSEHLPIDAPPTEVSTKAFAGSESGAYIACWLRRFYGRQALLLGPNGQPSFEVELREGVRATLVSSFFMAGPAVHEVASLRIGVAGCSHFCRRAVDQLHATGYMQHMSYWLLFGACLGRSR